MNDAYKNDVVYIRNILYWIISDNKNNRDNQTRC
jgi:hypothetical protein